MGVSYTAYAGFGLRINPKDFPSDTETRQSCNCNEKGSGKFCSSCGREIKSHTYEVTGEKWEELTELLEYSDPPGELTFVHKGEYMDYAYIGWFSQIGHDDGEYEESYTVDEIPSMETIRAEIRKFLSDYSEILVEKNFGFHFFMHIG